MAILDGIILFLIKLGLIVITFIYIVRLFIIIPYIWWTYDREIIKLKAELDNFRKKEKTRHAPQPIIDARVNHKARNIDEQLEILETKRRLLLDRVNLFLSISSIHGRN